MPTLPTAAFSIALDCQLDNVPGTLGRLCTAIGEAGGNIGALDGFDVRGPVLRRMGDVFGATVNLASRLTALARPGTTLVDAATAREVADVPEFSLRQMAPRRVRGVGIVRSFSLAADNPSR